jgi:Asp-tRNA(Asn)/Glu-tRNA(Gln) amidotransferase A subunit family amidase
MRKIIAAVLLTVAALCFSVFPAFGEGGKPQYTVDKNAILSALYEAEISEITKALREGLVSCEELTEYYLSRIKNFDSEYNCFITLCSDAAEKAKEKDKLLAEGKAEGLLFGVPVVIKDNMDLEGFLTTNGMARSKAKKAKTSADAVKYLLEEGAVIIGKTNMSTGAQNARQSYSKAAGHTFNAYNVKMASGGSSGGSAVAVSLNFAAAALGTDTNSSLRYPAALNGCVSLRATTGLISTEGCVDLVASRDVAGAITRTVSDQALMLDVLTGGKHGFLENLSADTVKGLKIGIISELSFATSLKKARSEKKIDDEIEAAFLNATEELESLGAEVKKVSMKKIFSLSEATFGSSKEKQREIFYDAFCEFLDENDLDAVIFPTYLSAPIKVIGKNGNELDYDSATYINNCKILSPSAEVPEITVPIGLHSRGSGIGMEIAAKRGCEQLLLDIAYSYTEEFDHRSLPEDAPNRYAESGKGSLSEIIEDKKAFESQKTEENSPPSSLTVTSEDETQRPADMYATVKTVAITVWAVAIVLIITSVIIALSGRKKR